MKVQNTQMFPTAHALNASFNGTAFQLNQVYGFCVQATVTGTPTGSFFLQACNDADSGAANPMASNPLANPTNWSTIANSTEAVSAAGVLTWNFNGSFYNYVRLCYTDGSSGSSTATVKATLNTKGV